MNPCPYLPSFFTVDLSLATLLFSFEVRLIHSLACRIRILLVIEIVKFNPNPH